MDRRDMIMKHTTFDAFARKLDRIVLNNQFSIRDHARELLEILDIEPPTKESGAQNDEEKQVRPNTRFIELHPPYPGAVWTIYERGAGMCRPSDGDASTGQESVCHVMRTYYEYTSSEPSLQHKIVALCWTIPDDFKEWAKDNAVVVEFRTESGTYLNSHVDVAIYKGGISLDITSYGDHVSTDWAVVSHSCDHLDLWKPGDVMEIYLKLASRNDYYARVGSIRFNYVSI